MTIPVLLDENNEIISDRVRVKPGDGLAIKLPLSVNVFQVHTIN